MRTLIVAIILLICVAVADAARVVQNPNPGRSLRLNRSHRHNIPRMEPGRGGNRSAPLSSKAGGIVLNCENDGIFDPANTLALDPLDLAGTIFEAPSQRGAFVIAEIDLGLFDSGSIYPADVAVLILEDDGSGTNYESIASFTLTLDTPLHANGEIINMDMRRFEVIASRDFLILYGAIRGTRNTLVLPAADSTARCLNEAADNACSVLLPVNEPGLFIYGVEDPDACPDDRVENKILNFDIVMEVLIEEQRVAVYEMSWGTLKSSY